MRYLFGFLYVCALVGTSPLSASAQAGEGKLTMNARRVSGFSLI